MSSTCRSYARKLREVFFSCPLEMPKFIDCVSTTPVKRIVFLNCLCRVCNLNLLISGSGRINLFDGVCAREHKIAARLSTILGFQVAKEIVASSILCMKCRREMKKFEKLFEALNVFRKKAKETLKEQKELAECGNSPQRMKRCYKGSPTSSSGPARKKSTVKSPLHVPKRSILTQIQRENLLPADFQVHNDLVVPSKKITSSIEMRSLVFFLSKLIFTDNQFKLNIKIVFIKFI